MPRYAERGSPRRLGSVVYDSGRPGVCGVLVSRTHYFAIVLVGGRRCKVPIERLRSGTPAKLANLEVQYAGR